jgi:hypothetical protein
MSEKTDHNDINIIRLIIKAVILFLIVNFGFIGLANVPYGKLTLYNQLIPGRIRLPFGETPAKSYSFTMNNLDAMVASHVIAKDSDADGFRVVIIGDSSVWGFLQKPEDTLAGILQRTADFSCDGRPISFFNLGYPSLSVLKDLMVIEKIREFDPDLVLWMITLESLPNKSQLETPLVMNNPILANRVIRDYQLDLPEIEANPMQFSVIGQRRNLADLFRHQMVGVLWAATGIDQEYPRDYNPAQRDFSEDESFKDFTKNQMNERDLSIDAITNTISRLSDLDFLVINEPILISQGANSHLRYNFYYPRWAYDRYREIINKRMVETGIKYYDLWDIVPESEFTNSAIHLSEYGQMILAEQINIILNDYCH